MKQAVAFNRILERLLVGLVPIRARAVDYAVVRVGGTPQIIHRSGLDGLPSVERESADPLFVVGFSQQDLFWKDLRTVLFGQHRFVLTGRLSTGAVQGRWSPVKLAEVLRQFMPELADQLNEAGRGLANAMEASADSADALSWDRLALRDALVEFVARVTADESAADEIRRLLDGGGLEQARDLLDGSLEQTRAAFALTVDLLGQVREPRIDETEIARHRSDVIEEYGLPPAPPREQPENAPMVKPDAVSEWYLEAEVIALYW